MGAERDSLRPALYASLILAVTLPRLLYVGGIHRHGGFPGQFSAELVTAARAILETGSIRSLYPGVDAPSAHVAPFPAYLLAGIFLLTGYATPAAAWGLSLWAISATAAWVCLLPSLAQKLVGTSQPGWWAAFAYAVYPGNFYLDSVGDWEQPLATLLALGILRMGLGITPSSSDGWRIGAILGLLALVSPALIFAALLVIGFASRNLHAGKRWRFLITAFVTAACIVLPWTMRNLLILGQLIPIRSNGGLELAVGNHDYADGRTPLVTLADVQSGRVPDHPYVKPSEAERVRLLGEAAYMSDKRRQALAWIAEHPCKFIRLTVTRTGLYWLPPCDLWPADAKLGRANCILYNLGTILGIVGLILVARQSRQKAIVVAAFLIGASLPYLITHVSLRYRYPINGVVWLLSATVLIAGISGFFRDRSKSIVA